MSGSEESFAELYAATASRLVVQIYLVTGDVEEARDCVQDGFARAWLRWDALRRTADDPVAWIYTVSYRIAVSRFRRRLANGRALRWASAAREVPALPGPSAEAIALRDALATLPHGQRAVLVLHYYEGMSVDEVGQILQLKPGTVKARLSRGRAALRHLLVDPQSPPTGITVFGSPA